MYKVDPFTIMVFGAMALFIVLFACITVADLIRDSIQRGRNQRMLAKNVKERKATGKIVRQEFGKLPIEDQQKILAYFIRHENDD